MRPYNEQQYIVDAHGRLVAIRAASDLRVFYENNGAFVGVPVENVTDEWGYDLVYTGSVVASDIKFDISGVEYGMVYNTTTYRYTFTPAITRNYPGT